jgi:hypothetical protein
VTYLALAAGLVLIGGFLVLAFRPPREFVVEVSKGRAKLRRGKAHAEFVEAVGEACAAAGVRSGRVEGIKRDGRVSLTFSGDLPGPLRQRIRNLYHLPR